MNKKKTYIDDFLRIIGYNIMRVRLNKGIYLPAVGKALSISVYVLKNIEDGKYPKLNIETLYQLSEHFKVNVAELFEGT